MLPSSPWLCSTSSGFLWWCKFHMFVVLNLPASNLPIESFSWPAFGKAWVSAVQQIISLGNQDINQPSNFSSFGFVGLLIFSLLFCLWILIPPFLTRLMLTFRFPNQIMNIINAKVALTRIQKFMQVSHHTKSKMPSARLAFNWTAHVTLFFGRLEKTLAPTWDFSDLSFTISHTYTVQSEFSQSVLRLKQLKIWDQGLSPLDIVNTVYPYLALQPLNGISISAVHFQPHKP